MDKTIKEQLEAIRRSGETNMLDVNKVQYIANREGYYELVVFIEEHRSEYINFIFHGDTADNITAGETIGYHYNLVGQARKEFVDTISRILDTPAVYQKAPTFSYRIGDYTVDKEGTLSFTDNVPPEDIKQLIAKLAEGGYGASEITEDIEGPEDGGIERATESPIPQATTEPDTLTVKMPRAGMTETAYDNLQKIIASKATLLKQALDTDTLEIRVLEEELSFPWFTLHGLEGEADAYLQLITSMVKMAKRQKRVTATEKPIENAKFEMRLFLVRLDLVGDGYKTARKILLRNLTGNSSWKSGRPPQKQAGLLPEIPPDSATASGYVPAITDNTETGGASGHIHSDTFPEDKGDAP